MEFSMDCAGHVTGFHHYWMPWDFVLLLARVSGPAVFLPAHKHDLCQACMNWKLSVILLPCSFLFDYVHALRESCLSTSRED